MGILEDFGSFVWAVGHEFKFLIGLLGWTVFRFWEPLFGRKMQSYVFWSGIFVCLFGAFFNAWRKEHKKAVLFNALPQRYRDIVLEWRKLDDLYQNSTKDEYAPKTLQSPMASWQLGDFDFRYRVGFLQARTYGLISDLERLGIDIGLAKADVRSVPELLAVLERCKL